MRYDQIKPLLDEQVLDEVKMSPSALQKFANSPEAEGMLMGIEFEMCVPNVAVDDDSGEGEYDYDMDERAYDIDGIIDFFRSGDMATLSSSGADRLRNEMWDQYLDWQSERISDNIDHSELEDRIRDALREDYDVDDYMDDAAEELGIDPTDNDENEVKVRERATELRDEYVESLLGDSREYDNYYDRFRQEMEDDMRDDGDYDQEAWLRDIGIDYMSEAEREWSLDWPHWTYYGGDGELDVETVGDEFGRAMGLEFVNTSSNYHGARRDGKNWIIEPDSSIDADSGDGGLEFVSPPMPIKDGLEMIQKMYAWAKKEGCYTNKSTGLHMNISVPDMTIDKLDYVKLALFLGDEYVLKQFGREYNNYCKSAISKIKDRVRPEDVPAVLNQMKQHLNSLASKTIHSGITDKYTSINTKSNYVEFRGPGGDYLDQDPFEIINTALRLSMSLRIATDPEAYKQEYAKKLYKLVEQEKNPDESVKLFSKYAVGELPKEDLLARLKFARKEREIAKGKKDHVSRMMDDPQVKDKVNDLPFKWRQHLRDNIGEASDQQLQSLVNNLNSGEYDEELTPEQRDLVSSIVANELEWRKVQGEKKAYWVMNKDGTGGKQLVYAHNENEAILKGGSQMGMKREESITKLRAEEKRELTTKEILDSLPKEWQEFLNRVTELTPTQIQNNLNDFSSRSEPYIGMSPEQKDLIVNTLRQEQQRREGSSTNNRKKYSRDIQNIIASMPNPFASFTKDIPIKNDEILATAARKAADGEFDDSLTREQRQLLILLINDEQAHRAAYGEGPAEMGTELEFQTGEPLVDEPALPTNWDDWIRTIQSHETVTLNNVARMVRQGGNEIVNSLTASDREYLLDRIRQEIERRATGGSNAGTTAAPLRVGTPEPENAQAVYNSLPDTWISWLAGMGAQNPATLQSVIDAITNGSSVAANSLDVEQKDLIISRIQTELRSRREEASTEWPRPWNQWVANIQGQGLANINNVRANMADPAYTGSVLSNEQKRELVRLIDVELRRRMEAGEEPPQQELDFSSPDDEDINDLMGGSDEDPAVAQQSQLINRDDPVTSNDPESESPIAGQGTESFEIYNPETMQIVSVVRQGTMDYAVQKARQHEQSLGLEAGTLSVRSAGQTNESISMLRKLAGIN